MPKRALVISGGGSKGAFAVGVVKSLINDAPATSFDIYVGTSTGSLIAPFAAAGAITELETVYTTTTTGQIIETGDIMDRLLGDNSLFNADPLAQLITRHYTDDICNTLLTSPKELYLATTCLQTGETVYFSTKNGPASADATVIQVNSPDLLRRAVMASACQPVLMPPIEVEQGKVPLRQYVDGGVRVYAGIQLAIDAGADEVYAVLLSPAVDPPEDTNYGNAFNILNRTIDIFTVDTAVNNLRRPMLHAQGLQYIADIKAAMLAGGISQNDIDRFFAAGSPNPFRDRSPVNIYVIRPDAPLGGGPGGLDFVPADMTAMLEKGMNITRDFLANLPPRGSGMV